VQDAAARATLDHLASQERTANQESQETTVNLDSLAVRQQFATLSRHHRANRARRVQREPMVRQDHPVSLDQTDLLDHQAKMAAMVNLDHLDHLAQTASPAPMAPEETQESQARRRRQSPESQEVQASPDPPDLQDHLDRPDPMDKPEAPDRRDHPDRLDQRERMASPAKTAPLALPDRPARRASAPSIAPSTAVSSSKTALDANRSNIHPITISRLSQLSLSLSSLLASVSISTIRPKHSHPSLVATP